MNTYHTVGELVDYLLYTRNCLGCEIASHSELPKQWWCAGVNDHGVEDWHLV